jgi:NAD-dependent SIR2 family protein deacetylase
MRQKLTEVAKRFADSSSDESSVDDSRRNSPSSSHVVATQGGCARLSRHGPQQSMSRQSSASPAQESLSSRSQSRQSASSPCDIASAVSVEKGAKLCAGDSEGEEMMPAPHPRVLKSFDLEGLAEYIKTNCKNIIVMAGAGISVSAGLPDFRTPGTGLYDNLAKYNLPEPTAVFNINFFRGNPAPFYMLAKELFPGQYKPTPTHNFIRLLNDRGLLLRCFTQNIDSLEAEAGIPKDKIVAAHGNFDSATCIDTGQKVPVEEVRAAIMAGPEGYAAMNAKYGVLVKPDISFFGEKLPDRFYQLAGLDDPGVSRDLYSTKTSLLVQKFKY